MNRSAPVLLAVDTSTAYLSVGLHAHGQNFVILEHAGTRHSEILLPAISGLLADTGLTVADIEAFVYAKGPGSFTGLRIGLGVVEGLALPYNRPLIGIPSLDAVAEMAPGEPCVLAVTDARMNECFYAWYDTKNHCRLSGYGVGAATDIVLPADTVQAVGIGSAYTTEHAAQLPVPGTASMPDAGIYLQLALSGRYAREDAAEAALLYVRNNIALTAVEQAARKSS